jgi:hypothetical protein
VIGRLQLTYSTKLIHGIHIYHNQCGESRRVRVRNLGPIRPRRLRAGNMGGDTSPLPPPPPAPLSATPPPELAPRHNLRGQQGWWWRGAAFGPASGGCLFVLAGGMAVGRRQLGGDHADLVRVRLQQRPMLS